jgi:hypothetical protein
VSERPGSLWGEGGQREIAHQSVASSGKQERRRVVSGWDDEIVVISNGSRYLVD